jgi:APA family basic amino acid/polyamine antiporter
MAIDIGTSGRFRLRSDRDDPRLLRALGAFSGAFAILAVTIGGGIVSVPQRVAEHVSSAPLILGLWAMIGVVCFIGGLVWAEMGTRMPYSGGDYLYLTRAYGSTVGFLYGWKTILLSGPQNRAALALVVADYAGALTPLSDRGHLLVAVSALLLTGGVNYVGVIWASRFQNLSATLKILGLLALAVLGFILASPASSGDAPLPATGAVSHFPAVLLLIFFSYTGWARLGYMTGEMKNPRRDLPWAIGIGMGGTVLIYMLVNWLSFRVLGLQGVRESPAVLSDVASGFLGAAGSALVAGLIVISVTGSMSVSILAQARFYLSMAKDGLFFRFFDSVHPVFHTPHRAVAVHVGLAILALLLIRDVTKLLTSAVFVNAIFYVLKGHTLFRLRRARVGEDGCYKVPLYPWLPLLFLLMMYALCAARLILDWQRAWIDLTLLLIGIPAYLGWRRLRAS